LGVLGRLRRRGIDASLFIGEDPLKIYMDYVRREGFKTSIYTELMPELIKYTINTHGDLYNKCLSMTRCPQRFFICAFWAMGESRDKKIANMISAALMSLGAREKLRVVTESKKLDRVIKHLSRLCAPGGKGSR